MADLQHEVALLLQAARLRGETRVSGAFSNIGLDHFTAYVGLIDRALEYAKLAKTEKRDLAVIQAHYDIEIAKINTAFAELEIAMRASFKSDKALMEKTMEAVNLLIQKGEYELASEFHKRLIENFKRTPLDALIDLRNAANVASGTRIYTR